MKSPPSLYFIYHYFTLFYIDSKNDNTAETFVFSVKLAFWKTVWKSWAYFSAQIP